MSRCRGHRALLASFTLTLAACRGPAPHAVGRESTPDAAFRFGPPAPPPALSFALPTIREVRLENGIRLFLAPRHDLPIVSIAMTSRCGADSVAPGVAAVYAVALSRGASMKHPRLFTDALAKYGGTGKVFVDHDRSELLLKVLSPGLRPITETLRTLATEGVFLQPSVDAGRMLQTAARRRFDEGAGTLATITLAELLYPVGHPYRRPAIGDVDALAEVSARDVRSFHRMVFDASMVGVAIAGDFDETMVAKDLVPMIESLRDHGDVHVPESTARPTLPAGPAVTIIDRPGSVQARVFVGALGVTGSDPDRMALRVAEMVLSERVAFNLRETHAFTYASFADVTSAPMVGSITLGGAIETAHAAEALREILSELARISTSPPTESELNLAVTKDLAETASIFESTNQTALWLARVAAWRGSIADLEDEIRSPAKVAASEVARVVKAYLARDAIRIVIVGDAARFRAAIDAMALGEVEVRKAATTTPSEEEPSDP